MTKLLTPFVAAWALLATAVAILAIYRRKISHSEDELIHVQEAEAARVSHQAAVAQRLETVDRWGKILTVIALVYGFLIAAAYFYLVWQEGTQQIWS